MATLLQKAIKEDGGLGSQRTILPVWMFVFLIEQRGRGEGKAKIKKAVSCYEHFLVPASH